MDSTVCEWDNRSLVPSFSNTDSVTESWISVNEIVNEDLVRDNEDERLRNGLISPSTISQWFSKSIQEGVRGGNWWDENDKAGYWRIRLVPLLITGI